MAEVRRLLLEHLQDHYGLYGEYTGVRSARKHIGWYVRGLPGGEAFRERMNGIEDCAAQLQAVAAYFDALGQRMDRLPALQQREPAGNDGATASMSKKHIEECVRNSLEGYFRDLRGDRARRHVRDAGQGGREAAAGGGDEPRPSRTSRAPPSGWA